MRVTYGRGSSSFGAVAICFVLPALSMTAYLFLIVGLMGHVETGAATPLRRRAQANAPAAWCCLRRVP